MEYQHITVDASLGPLGAEVSGFDLKQALSDEVLREIKTAWIKHHVLFFRDQNLSPDQQAKFAENFGVLDVYPFMKAVEGHPNVIPIIKETDATLNFGGAWHTDTSYLSCPPMATLLCAVDVPDEGGDTLFADATAAYADLSAGLKAMLEGLSGIYSPKLVHGKQGDYAKISAKKNLGDAYGGDVNLAESEVEHPLVRTHVETGNKSIYCSKPHTHRIKGWTREESLVIFRYLTSHLTQEKYITRFKWENGSMALWDNRCVFHNALNDYQGKRRHMHRVIVQGERPQ